MQSTRNKRLLLSKGCEVLHFALCAYDSWKPEEFNAINCLQDGSSPHKSPLLSASGKEAGKNSRHLNRLVKKIGKKEKNKAADHAALVQLFF